MIKLWEKRNRITQSINDADRHRLKYEIYGNVPCPLFKAFQEREHAENFCKGEIRFRFLEYFKALEGDCREDGDEGVGQVRVDGEQLIVNLNARTLTSAPGIENHNYHTTPESHLICCFSRQLNGGFEHLPTYFGDWLVKIKSPLIIIRSVAFALTQDKQLMVNPPYLQSMKVIYNQGAYIGKSKSKSKMMRLAWAQKPPCYSGEMEYRLHLHACLPGGIQTPDNFFRVNIGDISHYCEIIRRQ